MLPVAYILFAQADAKYEKALSKHLFPVENFQKALSVLREKDMEGGLDRKAQWEEALKKTDMVILLVSANFWPSCYDLARAAMEKGKRVIPVLIGETKWRAAEFGGLLALPKNEVPVEKWANKDSAWVEIVEGLSQVAASIKKEKAEQKNAAPPAKEEQLPPLDPPPPPPVPITDNEKIRILFLTANAHDTTRLRLDEEYHQVDQRIIAAKYRDRFELIMKPAARVNDFQSELMRYSPHIVHFSGHGVKEGGIVMVDPDQAGKSRLIHPLALRSIFRVLNENLFCVVLNACYSAQTPQQARALADAAGCVVGMANTIKEASAIAFAASFYEALAFGKSFQDAFEIGKNGILVMGGPDAETPQLHHRSNVIPKDLRLLKKSS